MDRRNQKASQRSGAISSLLVLPRSCARRRRA
jgi:hypothetical protein